MTNEFDPRNYPDITSALCEVYCNGVPTTPENRKKYARKHVTIFVPHGYKDGDEFARDCGFEIVRETLMPNPAQRKTYE